MGDRGTRLMAKADGQLSETIEFFATLEEADLRKACTDEGAEDSSGGTVAAVAAHTAEGYHQLGRFLRAAGYVPGLPETGSDRGRGHGGRDRGQDRGQEHRHAHGHAPDALPDMRGRLSEGKVPIGLLAELTDEQLDGLPPAGSSPFSDGRRTLDRVIEAAIAHQAAHLLALKRAVA